MCIRDRLYGYLDKTKIDQIVPPVSGANDAASTVTYQVLIDKATGSEVMNNTTMVNLFKNQSDSALTEAFQTLMNDSALYRLGTEIKDLSLPYNTASKYAFQAPADWGQRTSYGRAQVALQEMLAAEIQLDSDIADYIGFLQDMEQKVHRLEAELENFSDKESVKDAITGVRAGFTTAFTAAKVIINILAATEKTVDAAEDTAIQWVDNPLFAGLAVSVPAAPLKGAIATPAEVAKVISETAKDAAEAALEILNLVRDEVIARLERDVEELDQIKELEGLVEELENLTGADRPKRDAVGLAAQELEMKRQEYFTAISEGFRLLREREAFNKVLAASTQKSRYQDMIFRLTRNEAMAKYQSAFNNAARYTWLAARAYDYETSLEPGDPAAPTELFNKIVQERQLGLWGDGPVSGQGGLAEILTQMNSNFQALKGHLGIENPQQEKEKIS